MGDRPEYAGNIDEYLLDYDRRVTLYWFKKLCLRTCRITLS